jgi:H/ACA ribonucleoprotein complex subunit 3
MRIHKCRQCDIYTLKETCPECGVETTGIRPPKYSPEDPYGVYRRLMKKEIENG